MLKRQYYVYIMMNAWRTTSYIGVTNDFARRLVEHREGRVEGYTKKYRCHDLVYYESCDDVMGAIAREKEIKRWNRTKKRVLIAQRNPELRDLSSDCFV